MMQPVNQVVPIETKEAPETRAAVLLIDRAILRRILMLPDGMIVGAVHYDWQQDALGVRLDSPAFPVTEACKMLPRLRPTYERQVLENGDVVVSLRSLEGEDGANYAP
jgi:hypothetical protein